MKQNFKSLILSDLDSVVERDPATASRFQAALFSSGFHSILCYRFNHWLWRKKWRLTARFLSQITRFFTGVEIHPAASIGSGFFIDHGMGVVIGETAEIGDNVTLYHNVTLGGTKLFDAKGKTLGKRHPTIGDNVVIGSGAQILGPIKIGDDVKVGANAVVIKDVENGATVVGVAAHNVVRKERKDAAFCAYGIERNTPDPLDEDIQKLSEKVRALEKQISALGKKQ